jgi:ABC-type uncharacterized transport system permease subunit
MLWRISTLARSAYFGLFDSGSLFTYLANVVLRPVTMVCLFGYVTRTVGSDDDVRRVAIGANILVLNWNTVGGPLMTLGWELGNGTIGMNLASPANRAQFLASRALPHIPNGLLCAVVGGIAAFLIFDLDLSGTNWLVVALAVPLIIFSFVALGLVCGVGSLFTREVTAFIGVSAIYIYLLSGGIVPLASLPRPVEVYSAIVPGRWGIAAVQRSLNGDGVSLLWQELILEVLVCLLYFGIALAGFTLYERRAKTNGSVDVV